MSGTKRKDLRPGITVRIVLKADQRTGRLNEGQVARILTNSSFHPRGIKVMLQDGRVGRVKEILDSDVEESGQKPVLENKDTIAVDTTQTTGLRRRRRGGPRFPIRKRTSKNDAKLQTDGHGDGSFERTPTGRTEHLPGHGEVPEEGTRRAIGQPDESLKEDSVGPARKSRQSKARPTEDAKALEEGIASLRKKWGRSAVGSPPEGSAVLGSSLNGCAMFGTGRSPHNTMPSRGRGTLHAFFSRASWNRRPTFSICTRRGSVTRPTVLLNLVSHARFSHLRI
ncbi:hypothetical protein CYMTET_28905 [Cymbomonas tetramitiformis]|uniref:YwbE family protein n=1 Tax=Cymbomonas tetramitiformis TaxID=36881 RepID=A0AAE0FLV9_9CHLO|nr:hypothetical protein CYMTET_28905 [Cymbomonas tetramitiformis]